MKKAKSVGLPDPPVRDRDGFVLPHDHDAERAVLGAAMLRADAADYIADTLKPGAFHRRVHASIFEAMQALRSKNVAVDFLPLREELARRKTLEEVGEPLLTKLTDGVPHGVNIEDYAQILKDMQLRRALAGYAERTLNLIATREHRGADVLAEADRMLLELSTGHVDGRLFPLAHGVPAMMDRMSFRHEHRGRVTGIATGFDSIDGMTFGWQRGDLILIGARPSIGKTTFAMNSAVAAAKLGLRVAIFSLEMRRSQLEDRLLSSLAGIDHTRVLGGDIEETEWDRVSACLSTLSDLPIWVDDRAHQTVTDIRAACRRLKREGGLDLIVVDYAQLITGERGNNRNEELSDISRRLKVLADEVQAPIILPSQLSRDSSKRDDPRPKLQDFRDSGALEQDADLACFLHRKNHREGGLTYFILEKQRNGPTGTQKLTIDRSTLTFTDGFDGVDQEAPAASETAPAKATGGKPWHRRKKAEKTSEQRSFTEEKSDG